MKYRIILCAILCTGCSRSIQPSLTSLSSKAQSALDRGDAQAAAAFSRRGALLASVASSDWKWKFRCLQAEVSNAQSHPQAAYSLLADDLPPELSEREIAVRVQLDRAAALVSMRQLDKASVQLDSAAKLCLLPQNKSWSSLLEYRRGILAFRKNDPEGAEAHLLQAISSSRKYGQQAILCNAMTYLAQVLISENHFGRAMEWLVPATEVARRLSNRRQLETNLANWSTCSYKLGDLDSALKRASEAEQIAAELDRPLDREASLNVIGLIYSEREDFKKAAAYYSRGLNFARQANDAVGMGECLHNLAMNALDADDLDGAERFSREEIRVKKVPGNAYASLIEGQLAEKRNDFTAAETAFRYVISQTGNDLSLRMEAQFWLAKMHVASDQPALARQDFEEVFKTISLARRQLSNREFQIKFRSGLNHYYSDYIRFLMDRHKYLDALNIAEFSRGLVLSEHLGTPDNARLDEDGLRRTAQSMNAAILFYWLAPRESYLWVVTPGKVIALSLPSGRDITELAEAHRMAVASSASLLNTRLYEAIISPARQYIPLGGRVIVIPDGDLHKINFETLLVPGRPQPHYWIEDAIISTASSIALMHPSPRPATKGKILLIGDATPSSSAFPNLPNAGVELHSIAAKFQSGRSELYDKSLARPSNYKTFHPGDFAWIHFAAHADASKDNPLDSAIILSNEGDSYRLYARDIANIPLTADLVTISACYGSGATTYAGEGIVGLAWAFLYAGAHNVIASLWEVSDVYTAQLMDELYERLRAGDDAASALRTAKLTLVHSDYAGHNPRYWGAFQLYTGY